MIVGSCHGIKQSYLTVPSAGVKDILQFFSAQVIDSKAGKSSSSIFIPTQISKIKLNQFCIVIKIHFH